MLNRAALWKCLDQMPWRINGATFDPRPLIAAVNALRPLGKTAALDLLLEYSADISRLRQRWDTGKQDYVLVR